MKPNIAYILLGTNLSDREGLLNEAKSKIEKDGNGIIKQSSIYESVPWGFESDQLFLNQVITVETILNAFQLLEKLLAIENTMGRIRIDGSYTSRTIDLDILYFNNEVINSESLTIPHPRLHLRKFTMLPMAEIAPNLIHPTLLLNQTEILDLIQDKNEVKTFYPQGRHII